MATSRQAVLPGYDKYRSVMSNETAPYVGVQKEKPAPAKVISVIVRDSTPTNDLVPIQFDQGFARDDAEDLEASSDPDD